MNAKTKKGSIENLTYNNKDLIEEKNQQTNNTRNTK